MRRTKADPADILRSVANAVGVTVSVVRRYAASARSRSATNARSWLDNLWAMVWGTREHKRDFNFQLPVSTINALTEALNDPASRNDLGNGGSNRGGTNTRPGSRNTRPLIQRAPPTEAERDEWTDEVLVPHSSNVYSFQYHQPRGRTKGVLYVTYKAPNLNHSSLSIGRGNAAGVTGKRQLVGKLGSTHRGGARPNAPGPKYAYSGVPISIFYEMQAAANTGGSVGKQVWDKLRVRHSHFQHRYPYSLVSPSVHPETGQEYIPRKATAKGYASRSVHAGGRFNFKTSTLAPSQTGGGFSTRKPRKP